MTVIKFMQKVIWIFIRSMLTTAIVIGLVFTYAYKIEPAWIQVREQPVSVNNLPAAFEGLRIVHLSDLHGRLFPDKDLVLQVNRLKPDVVVITGDVFDDDKEMPPEYAVNILGGINARYGSFFVYGNNDKYLNKDEVSRAFAGIGFKTLDNQSARISAKNQDLWIIGVDDPHEGKADIAKSIKDTGKGPKILLAHSPEIVNEAAIAGIDLALAGHSHGGQINIPYVPRLITYVKKGYEKYVAGLYKVGNTQMYVTRGLGVTKIPMRFLARPEISVITLHRSGGNP